MRNFKRLALTNGTQKTALKLVLALVFIVQNASAVQVFWKSAEQPLAQESKPKDVILHERGVTWVGRSLTEIVDSALKLKTASERSQIDLVMIEGGEQGIGLSRETVKKVYLPRAFLVKYPKIILAHSKGSPEKQMPLEAQSLELVLPRKTTPKIENEGILLDLARVSQVTKIILTSYQDEYQAFRLQKRTDPSAMRGEKLFLQNCIFCHGDKKNITIKSAALKDVSTHSPFSFDLFSKRDIRSIDRYIDLYRKQINKD